jgi:cytochrome c oxidase subunit 6b
MVGKKRVCVYIFAPSGTSHAHTRRGADTRKEKNHEKMNTDRVCSCYNEYARIHRRLGFTIKNLTLFSLSLSLSLYPRNKQNEEEQVAAEEEEQVAEEEEPEQEEEAASEDIVVKTTPFDPRFPQQNQAKHCYTRYNEYHKCAAENGEEECASMAKLYRSICPGEWVEKWNEERENGTWAGRY